MLNSEEKVDIKRAFHGEMYVFAFRINRSDFKSGERGRERGRGREKE